MILFLKRNLVIKNCIFILIYLNLSHLKITIHLMQYTYWDIFSTVQNSFWTQFWCLLELLPFLKISPLPHHWHIFLWGLFWGNKKKVTQDQSRWTGRVGQGGHAIFGQKLLNTQHGVGRCTHKPLIMIWANMLKESSKKIHGSRMQSLTTPPAGTLIHIVCENTPLAGEACTTRSPPSRREFFLVVVGVSPHIS